MAPIEIRIDKRPVTGILFLLAFTAAVAVPASASAATYCVNTASSAECSGTKEATIEAAIAAAGSSAGRDTIDVAGGHFYEEPAMIDTIGNQIDLVGIGATPPILSAPTPGATVLTIENETSTLYNLQISISGAGSTGLVFHGAVAKKLAIAGLAAGNESVGIELRHGALRESTVQMARSATVGTVGVQAADNTVVEASTLAATWVVSAECCEAHVTVSRVETLGPVGVRATEGGHLMVENSLLLVSGVTQGNGTSAAIDVFESLGGASTLKVDDVTAIDTGAGATAGILVGASAGTEAAAVRNSIVRGFDTDLRATTPGAAITGDYDDYASAAASGGATVKAGTHDLDLDPAFVNIAGGDFHLAVGSPLIDRGDPAGSTASVDFYGAPRLTAGLGAEPLLDIGAAEFVPTVSVAPPLEGSGGGPGAGMPSDSGRAAGPRLVLSKARRRLGHGGTFTYAIGCPASLSAPCEGTVELATSAKVKVGKAKGRKASSRVLPFGAKPFAVAPGSTRQLVVRPDRQGRQALDELGMLRLTATATARVADSATSQTVAKFELLAPARR